MLYKLLIKENARIELENGRMLNTPIALPIKDKNELDKWILKLRINGITDYSIDEMNKVIVPKVEHKLKKTITTKVPIRPSRKERLQK